MPTENWPRKKNMKKEIIWIRLCEGTKTDDFEEM